MNPHLRTVGLAAIAVLSALSASTAFGQTYQAPAVSPGEVCFSPPTLGTFEPTPYIMVGGAAPLSRGYSPLGIYGDGSMALNGPFSPMRSTSAPVTTYNRGYDGVIRPRQATSFSNPNLPRLSPFVYPTQRSNYYAPRSQPNARLVVDRHQLDRPQLSGPFLRKVEITSPPGWD